MPKGNICASFPCCPLQASGMLVGAGFALEPVPWRSVRTLLPASLEKTRVLMLLVLWHLLEAAGRSLHTAQAASACSSAHMGQARYITDLGLLQHYLMLIHFALSETTASGEERSHLPRAAPGHRLHFPGIAGAPLCQPHAAQGRQCSYTQRQRRLGSLRAEGVWGGACSGAGCCAVVWLPSFPSPWPGASSVPWGP